MKDLLAKISSYNLFNYLFPGILFAVILEKISTLKLLHENIIIGVFIYYFSGLIISRIGSIIIEPLLIKLSFVKFASHEDFVLTSKKDEKIELLLEVNNMYRTLITLFVVVLCITPYETLYLDHPKTTSFISIIALIILFLWSYIKQTNYITKRIESNKE